MKREYETSNVPFSNDLVFYAPLSEGDLSDHISGVEPTTDIGCSVTWDDENKMYRCYTYDKYKSSLIYDCMANVIPINGNLTISIDIKEISIENIYNMIFGLPSYSYGASPCNYNLAYLRHDRFNNSTTNLLSGKISVVYDNLFLKFYNNGNLVNTLDWRGATNVRTDIGGVHINQVPNNNYNTIGTICVKDARIYNRALTDEEIKQL